MSVMNYGYDGAVGLGNVARCGVNRVRCTSQTVRSLAEQEGKTPYERGGPTAATGVVLHITRSLDHVFFPP
jgi:hypothetical protein